MRKSVRKIVGPLKEAALVVDRRMPVSVRRRVRYLVRHHRLLHLRNPRTFTEKVQWRTVHDRRDLIAFTCDKLAMKEHALQAGLSELRVPRTYWAGTDLRELTGVDLPERWVLKPNHRFGLVHLGSGAPDVDRLVATTRGWLDEVRSLRGEWAYSQARRCFVVEEMIGTEPPDDFKFFVFEGEPRLVQYSTDRFSTGHRARLYTPDWRPAGGTGYQMPDVIAPPARLDEMLSVASTLGKPFDFIRVDLYDVDGATWFGELTPYPGSGLRRFDPRELDEQLGAAWTLPRGEGIR